METQETCTAEKSATIYYVQIGNRVKDSYRTLNTVTGDLSMAKHMYDNLIVTNGKKKRLITADKKTLARFQS